MEWIKFPNQRLDGQLPAPASGDTLIAESLVRLISTPRRTRLMRPRLGKNAADYVFENNTVLLAENIRTDIATAVAQYETRVVLRSIDVLRDEENGAVRVIVNYVIKRSLQEGQVAIQV